MKEEFKKIMNDFDKAVPKDHLSQVTGLKEGTAEHTAQKKLVGAVKSNNSTDGILNTTKQLMNIGIIALIFNFFAIKIPASIFDLMFHFDYDHHQTATFAYVFGGIVLAVILVWVAHATSNFLYNDTWGVISKVVLGSFFLGTLLASLYLDNRAITNFNKQLMETRKGEDLNNTSNVHGAILEGVKKKEELTQSLIENDREQLKQYQTILNQLMASKLKIEEEISEYKAQKANTSDKKKIRTLNSNIYTSRKQKEGLQKDIDKYTSLISSLKASIADKSKELGDTSTGRVEAIKGIDEELSREEKERVFFAWVLVILIEVLSQFITISKILKNINFHENLSKEDLAEIDELIDEHNVNQAFVSNLKSKLIAGMAQENQIAVASVQAIQHMGQVQMMEGVNQAYQTTRLISEAQKKISEVKRVAVKSQVEVLRLSVGGNLQKEAVIERGDTPVSEDKIGNITRVSDQFTTLEDGRTLYPIHFTQNPKGGLEHYYRKIDELVIFDEDFRNASIVSVNKCPRNIKPFIKGYLKNIKSNNFELLFYSDVSDIRIPTERVKKEIDLSGVENITQAIHLINIELQSVPIAVRSDVTIIIQGEKVSQQLQELGYSVVRRK